MCSCCTFLAWSSSSSCCCIFCHSWLPLHIFTFSRRLTWTQLYYSSLLSSSSSATWATFSNLGPRRQCVTGNGWWAVGMWPYCARGQQETLWQMKERARKACNQLFNEMQQLVFVTSQPARPVFDVVVVIIVVVWWCLQKCIPILDTIFRIFFNISFIDHRRSSLMVAAEVFLANVLQTLCLPKECMCRVAVVPWTVV